MQPVSSVGLEARSDVVPQSAPEDANRALLKNLRRGQEVRLYSPDFPSSWGSRVVVRHCVYAPDPVTSEVRVVRVSFGRIVAPGDIETFVVDASCIGPVNELSVGLNSTAVEIIV
jgi:hypothetical protein